MEIPSYVTTVSRIQMEIKRQTESYLAFLAIAVTLLISHTSAAHPRLRGSNGDGQADVIKLRVGVPSKAGFKEIVKVDYNPQTNDTIVSGFCVDVFRAAIEYLPYHVEFEFIPFVNDRRNPAGTYNDLIDQVYLQNYDAVVGDTTITANRSLFVDFTLPYTDIGVGIVAPKRKEKSIWIFLKPLTAGLWVSSAAFFLLTGIVVWVIERPINDEFQGPPSQQIGTVFWFSFSTLVFAHREKLLSNLSKFVVVVWVFVVLILTSSYTATLTSMMTIQQIQLNSRDNNIGYQSGSFIGGFVRNFDLDNPSRQVFGSEEEYAEALSKGSKNGGVSYIIDEIPYIKLFLAKNPNSYSMIGSPIPTTNGFAFVFRKGSPLVPYMSRAIAKLREEGELIRIENAWFKVQSTFIPDDSSGTADNVNPLTLESFRGLFVISGMSSTLALVIFVAFALRDNWHVVKKYSQKIRERFRFVKMYVFQKIFSGIEDNKMINPESLKY